MLPQEELKRELSGETIAFPSPMPTQQHLEALRQLDISEGMQKQYGYRPLGAADGPVKSAIFGGNNARLYRVTPKQQAEVLVDRIAQVKDIYEKHGADRSGLAYGYVHDPRA